MKRIKHILIFSTVAILIMFFLSSCIPISVGKPVRTKSEKAAQASKKKEKSRNKQEVVVVKGPEEFDEEILQADGPIFVDFGAHWCPPCNKLSPHVKKLASEIGDDVKVVKLYEDETGGVNKSVFAKYRIRAFPTLTIWKDGKEVARTTGYRDYAALEKWVNSNV